MRARCQIDLSLKYPVVSTSAAMRAVLTRPDELLSRANFRPTNAAIAATTLAYSSNWMYTVEVSTGFGPSFPVLLPAFDTAGGADPTNCTVSTVPNLVNISATSSDEGPSAPVGVNHMEGTPCSTTVSGLSPTGVSA